jgi:hypothetical protein
VNETCIYEVDAKAKGKDLFGTLPIERTKTLGILLECPVMSQDSNTMSW